jgi:hypothetical protein
MVERYGRKVISRVREVLEDPPSQPVPSDARASGKTAALHDER